MSDETQKVVTVPVVLGLFIFLFVLIFLVIAVLDYLFLGRVEVKDDLCVAFFITAFFLFAASRKKGRPENELEDED